MKKVLDWVKGHLLIVIFCVIAVLVVPAGYVGSMMWNGKIKQAANDKYSEWKGKLDRDTRVSYQLPGVYEGESALSESRVPNRVVTEYYRAERAKRLEQVNEVVTRAVEANRGEHEPVIDGLFPEPASGGERTRLRLSKDLLRTLRGGSRSSSAFGGLLRDINAGPGVDSASLTSEAAEFRREREEALRLTSTGDGLSEAQQATLEKEVNDFRIGRTASRAAELSMFGDLDALIGDRRAGESSMPEGTPDQISPEQAFAWQWDYWVAGSVLDAIALANSDARGVPLSVAGSPFKRLDHLGVQELTLQSAAADSEDDWGGGGRTPSYPTGGAGGSGEWGASHTGRASASSDLYDVRMVCVEGVVATAKVPQLIAAIEQSGLMTVTDIDLSAADPRAELAAGYYFGPDHVSHAVIVIETVWLREWTKEFMPPSVRSALGIPLEQADGASEGEGFGEDEAP